MPVITTESYLPDKLRDRVVDLLREDETFVTGFHNEGVLAFFRPHTTFVTDQRFVRFTNPWLSESLSEVRLDSISRIETESTPGRTTISFEGSGIDEEHTFTKDLGRELADALRDQLAEKEAA